MARFGTKHAGQAISRAHGKSNSLFPVKFCYILRACLTKKSVIYVQNSSSERSDYNDLARRLFTSKRFQYCRFQNTFQLAFFPSLLSTCRSRLLFASLRERNLVPRAMPVRGLGWHWLWGNGMICVRFHTRSLNAHARTDCIIYYTPFSYPEPSAHARLW